MMTDEPQPPFEIATPPQGYRNRAVLPMSSGGEGIMLDGAEPPAPIKPNESARISSIPFPAHLPFRAEKLLVGGRSRFEWIVNDLLVDGVPQLEKPIATKDFEDAAPYPLQAMGPDGLSPPSSAQVLSLKGVAACTKEMVIIVTYVGGNWDGEHFQCAIIGEVPPRTA